MMNRFARHVLIPRKLYSLNFSRGARKKSIPLATPVPNFEKRLDVVIIGAPNAGKSVLLNKFLNSKLSATSRKRHTTRNEIIGVYNHRNIQLAFYDTPGFIKKSDARKLESLGLRESTTSSLKRADVVLLVVDASKPITPSVQDYFAEMVEMSLKNAKKEIILILNKVDLVRPKELLLDITTSLVSLINGIKLGEEKSHLAELDTTTFMISSLKDDGVVDIKNYLLSIADIKPWILKEEEGFTPLSLEERIEEIVREKLLDNFHDEIPYSTEIVCRDINPETFKSNKVELHVDLFVGNPRYQKILVGQFGRNLVVVRQEAVYELGKIFNKSFLLFLWVKLKKKN